MRSIEQLDKYFNSSLTVTVHYPFIKIAVDELINIAKKHRSDAKHDRNAIRAMRGEHD